jgi:glycosylphosphatidylinositol transamidase (GPIT) subunit GPI8
LIVIIDSCQASTMSNFLDSENVLLLSSSLRSQNSYALQPSDQLGVSVMDRYTYSFYEFFDKQRNKKIKKKQNWKNLQNSFDNKFLFSTPFFYQLNASKTVDAVFHMEETRSEEVLWIPLFLRDSEMMWIEEEKQSQVFTNITNITTINTIDNNNGIHSQQTRTYLTQQQQDIVIVSMISESLFYVLQCIVIFSLLFIALKLS